MKLNIENLSFGYLKRPLSVVDFSCKISDGEIVSIFGGEGAGKTSLLRVLSGLEKQYVGKIIFDKTETSFIPLSERNVSFIPSSPVVMESKTIFQNLEFFFKVNEMEFDIKEVQRFFEIFGFNFELKTKMKKLSRTNQKVFSLIRSCLKKPDLVLIDDLFENENENDCILIKNAILTYLSLKKHNTTVILVENFKNLIEKSNKYFYICFGKSSNFESITDLKTNPIDLFCADAFLKNKKCYSLLFDGYNYFLIDREILPLKKKKFEVIEKRRIKISQDFSCVLEKQKLEINQEMDVCLLSDVFFEELDDAGINKLIADSKIFVFDKNTFVKII